MGPLGWIALGGGAVVVFFVTQAIYLSVVLSWENEQTQRDRYYSRSPAERARFKRALRRHARFLRPILRLSGRSSKFDFDKASFRYQGIAGPLGSCSEASFAEAVSYQATREDVFVATQMKCGTTWMQHVVYEVLNRGQGDLVDSGRTLYGVCPWIEGLRSVSMNEAPLLGTTRPSRIIKTHLPAQLCPTGDGTKYIYVARHPVSCFASCVDFIGTNAGAMAPPIEPIEAWFCSPDRMWWGSWPDHVNGWWERAQRDRSTVLFVHFEAMKKDLAAVASEVAAFLGLPPLADEELAQVVEKCGFAYMQRHQDAFEMNPPHLLQTDAELFVRGTADRHRDVPDDVRARVGAWCRSELAGKSYSLDESYPEVG